ncbi:MAG: hypothetical protein KDB07_00545, partial [Planctomycetes bacterium]|nr:hypothetical protein [Planctomycetota bacterium]
MSKENESRTRTHSRSAQPKKRERRSTKMLEGKSIPNRMPVMPLLTVVVFPGSVMSFIVRKPHNIQ